MQAASPPCCQIVSSHYLIFQKYSTWFFFGFFPWIYDIALDILKSAFFEQVQFILECRLCCAIYIAIMIDLFISASSICKYSHLVVVYLFPQCPQKHYLWKGQVCMFLMLLCKICHTAFIVSQVSHLYYIMLFYISLKPMKDLS